MKHLKSLIDISKTKTNSAKLISKSYKTCYRYHLFFAEEKMNNFKISLFYEGKLIKEEVMDLSRGVRFHYGSADMQRNNVLSCKPEFKHYYDCNTCQFPVDCQNNERLTKAFENAAQGILLKSTDGCLEGVRLSQMVIHRSLPHSGSCAKMERYKEEKLFTYEDYAVSFTTNPYLKQELILSFGKKPRLCIPSLIMLKLQPEFVQSDDHSSMSTSLQNSIDRLTRKFVDNGVSIIGLISLTL